MPEIDPVILQLRADLTRYKNEIRSATVLVENQLGRQERAINDLEFASQRSAASISNAYGTISQRVGEFLAGFATGAVIRELSQLADQAKTLDAQLRLATSGYGSFNQAQADVQRIAQETRGSLEATTALYGGFARAGKETGRAQADAARATETFAKALKIGGAGAAEAASATLQFNQALQSGVLRGDEFNSILEASPRIARLLAEALGVPIGQLRGLAEEGKITSDVLFRALTDRRFTAGIDGEFKQLPVTFGDAMQRIQNDALIAFGEFDKGGNFSNALVSFLEQGGSTFTGISDQARAAGVEIRAVFDGLGNLFDPIQANAQAVFDYLGIRTFTLREQIASVLSSVDNVRNAYANLENFGTRIENSFKRGLNTAIDRAGGGQKFTLSPLLPQSTLSRDFLRGARQSEAAAQRRLQQQDQRDRQNAGTPAAPRASGGSAADKSKARARSGASEANREVQETARLVADIRRDLLNLTSDAGYLIKTEAEKLQEASRQFQEVFGDTKFEDVIPGAVTSYEAARDEELQGRAEAENRAQDIRENNVRSLAFLYEDLFQQGTDGVWRNFKDQGLRTLALILASATVKSFTAGGGGFGSLLKNIGGAASSFAGLGGLFGRASGGYVAPGQIVRVNEQRPGVELLRMGSQGGEVIPLGQTSAVSRPSPTTIVNAPQFNLRGAIITRELYADMQRISNQSAAAAGQAAYRQAVRDAPGAVGRAQRFGTS